MPDKADQVKHNAGTEVTFKCRFCGEIKPLRDMVVLKHVYPVMVTCSACNRAGKS